MNKAYLKRHDYFKQKYKDLRERRIAVQTMPVDELLKEVGYYATNERRN